MYINCSWTRLRLHDVCNYILKSNITKAIRLDISDNNTTRLHSLDIQGCENVTSLTLAGNQLTYLSHDAFSGMINLAELDLSNNRLNIMYNERSGVFLSGLPRLQILKINGNLKILNSAKYAYPNISSLISLQSLTVDGLYNTEFDVSYKSMINLENLNLNGTVGICNMGHLNENTFKNVPNLRVLDLSLCNLTAIDLGTFTVMNRLKWLDLSLNRRLGFRVLQNVSYGLQYAQIDFLNYSSVYKTFGLGTKLLIRDVCFLHNTTLREIAINGNRLELLEDNLMLLMPPTLNIVHAEENRFGFGPYLMQLGCLLNVSNILADRQNQVFNRSLFLNEMFNEENDYVPTVNYCPTLIEEYLKNQSALSPLCTYFGRYVFNYTMIALPRKLNILSVSKSNLELSFPSLMVMPIANEIETIDLSENAISLLAGSFGPLPSIKTVNLSNNYCSKIQPRFFSLWSNLEILDIRKNFIGIPLENDVNGTLFEPLKKLKYLILQTNRINNLPQYVFRHLINIEHLDLSYNTIKELTISIADLRNLTTLDLSSNAIEKLPDDVVDHFEFLHNERGKKFSINLQNNPIRCSCNNIKFIKWLVKFRSNFKQFDSYTFLNDEGAPVSVQQLIMTVSNFDKTCQSFTVLIVVCTVALSVFLSIVLCGFVYKNRWKLRYILYMKKKRYYGYFQVPYEEPIENYKYDAFISYSNNDIRFIRDELIPKLEGTGLKICVHGRDFVPGGNVADNIIDAIEASRKTIVFLSKSFLCSKWCVYEFNMARMESIYTREGGSCLIVVMLEPVPIEDMSIEMARWFRYESYIEYTWAMWEMTIFGQGYKMLLETQDTECTCTLLEASLSKSSLSYM